MLKLSNFEQQVNDRILSRGWNYYQDGVVIELEQSNENSWQAEVEGTDTYTVDVTLSKANEITEFSCTCPYEGAICKHIVAVLFAIRDSIQNAPFTVTSFSKKKTVNNLLKKIKLNELQHFIEVYASKDKDFKTEFELYFADKDEHIDVGKKYTDLIEKTVRKYAGYGFVDYRSASALSSELDKIIAKGHGFLDRKNFRSAFLVVKPVLQEMIEIVPDTDDSYGNISNTINTAIQLIKTIAFDNQSANEIKEEVFDLLQTELANEIYFEYGDYGDDLMEVFKYLAVSLGKSAQFLKFIDDQLTTIEDPYDDYRNDRLQTLRIDFLTETGNLKEAQELIRKNLDLVEVRKRELDRLLKSQDYKKAKALIADGIKIAEQKQHPGTVSSWQKDYLRIAVLEKDILTIRLYARKFAFDRGFDEDYYIQWKGTYSPTEWNNVIENHIEQTIATIPKKPESREANTWYRIVKPSLLSELAPIYIQEKYWDRLLALLKLESEIYVILDYHKYLFKEFPNELIDLYLPAFERQADSCNSRSEYAELARKMKMVIHDIPAAQTKIQALAITIKQKYPRRRAMIEELDNIVL